MHFKSGEGQRDEDEEDENVFKKKKEREKRAGIKTCKVAAEGTGEKEKPKRNGNKEPAGKKMHRESEMERLRKHWSACWEMKFPVHLS